MHTKTAEQETTAWVRPPRLGANESTMGDRLPVILGLLPSHYANDNEGGQGRMCMMILFRDREAWICFHAEGGRGGFGLKGSSSSGGRKRV
jgi:hypothetical protein